MARFSGISGVQSREWRKLVASYANSKKDYVRTVKFPLELPEASTIDFEDVKRLFDVTEGTDDGSLYGVLVNTHLAGFRFFPNARQNLSFRQLGKLEADFVKQWLSQADMGLKLSPSVIIEFAMTPRRKVKGTEKEFSWQTIISDFSLKIGLTASNRNQESKVVALAESFARRISSEFRSWDQMIQSRDRVLTLFDEEASSNNFSLPSVAGCLSANVELKPAECSIAFDNSLLVPEGLLKSSVGIHQVVAQKMNMLRTVSGKNPKPAEVQAEITTATNNALSWLFGTGFKYWRETPIEKIIEDFNVPDERHDSIENLQLVFRNVATDELFGSPHYSNFRSSVGGKLDSWIANYVSQLLKIEESLQDFEEWTLNDNLKTEPASRYFRALGLTHKELNSSINGIASSIAETSDALQVLLGNSTTLPDNTHVEQIQTFSNHISAVVGSLLSIKNAIQLDAESGQLDLVSLAKTCNFAIPKWLKPLPKVNQISGGIPDINAELSELEETFRDISALRTKYKTSVLAVARNEAELLPELMSQEQREAELLSRRKMVGASPTSQAKRNVLNRLCGLGRNGSSFLKQVLLETLASLFVSKKDLRRYLNNGLGSIYVSPFSTGRHEALRLNAEKLDEILPVQTVSYVREKLYEQVLKDKDFFLYQDLLRVEGLLDSLELSRLPEHVPREWLSLEEIINKAHVPAALIPLLSADTLTRQTVIKLSNLLTSQLNGALARAFRESFFVRAKFVRVGYNELHWVPKEGRMWSPPTQVESSSGPLGDAIRIIRDKTSNLTGPIDAAEGAEAILSGLSKDALRGSIVAPILQQMPHNWFLDLKITGHESLLEGFGVDKERIRRNSKKMMTPCRIVGSSASKTLIDKWLEDTEVKVGEHNIMFEQHYRQSVSLDNDLNPVIKIYPADMKAELALTITDQRKSKNLAHPIKDSVIGIDLGEAGIGFSVFDTEEIQRAVAEGREASPSKSGSVPVRSVRDLIKRVKRHRKIVQPRQRFRQGASTALEKLRDGALGDICFVIDALCAEHRGFPVLESSVVNLASGGKQLQLIYDKIVHTYYFSDVDAHKAARRHHWTGAENWEHPSLGETERKQDINGFFKPTGKRRALKLFPGSAVHPAGTSQVCSACYRNPYKIIDDSVADDGEDTFEVKDSRVELAGGDLIRLRQTKDLNKSALQIDQEMKGYARRKERPPYQYPVAITKIDQSSLKRSIRSQLRHGQKSTRSKDTTQSFYSCVFDDCGHQMHADENAAINIVRKWIVDKGIH